MKLIIGLGNPGSEYHNTRHNIGFLFLDYLLEKLNIESNWKSERKFKAHIQTITINGESVILAKPQTYMNLSGEAVRTIRDFYKISNDEIYVIFDDIDLPFGTIRQKPNGSAGTHNGMKSLIKELSSQDFPRLKIGIESRGLHAPEKQDLSSFVLSQFSPNEMQELPEILQSAEKQLKEWLNSA